MGRLTRDPNVRYSPRNNSQEEISWIASEKVKRRKTTWRQKKK